MTDLEQSPHEKLKTALTELRKVPPSQLLPGHPPLHLRADAGASFGPLKARITLDLSGSGAEAKVDGLPGMALRRGLMRRGQRAGWRPAQAKGGRGWQWMRR